MVLKLRSYLTAGKPVIENVSPPETPETEDDYLNGDTDNPPTLTREAPLWQPDKQTTGKPNLFDFGKVGGGGAAAPTQGFGLSGK